MIDVSFSHFFLFYPTLHLQLIMTTPMPELWNFGLSSNYGYEYFMQRPDGRILLGEWKIAIFFCMGFKL